MLVDNVLGAYVDYKGDNEGFKKYIDEKKAEQDKAKAVQDNDKLSKEKK